MERWNGRVALVTGASVGIGAAICRELVKHGMIVVGCARSVSKIEELANEEEVKRSSGRIHAIKCDLNSESEILSMFDEIRQKFGKVDVCINNAGFSTNSPLLSGEISDWRSMLQVNILALCICSRESVKLMRENGIDDGQIININSVGGHKIVSIPEFTGANFYCGTKFMVKAVTEGLRAEVKNAKTHIRVSSISPGLVATEFGKIYFKEDPEVAEALFKSMQPLQGSDIADAVRYIMGSPPHVEVNELIVTPVEQSF